MIERAQKMLRLAKTSWFTSSMMMGLSAIMFAINLWYKQWSIAASWFTSGVAWIIIEMKDRSEISSHRIILGQQQIIEMQHTILLQHGIIHEEAPEKEEVATP